MDGEQEVPSVENSVAAAIEKVDAGQGVQSANKAEQQPAQQAPAEQGAPAKPVVSKTADTPAHVQPPTQAAPQPQPKAPDTQQPPAPQQKADDSPTSWKPEVRAKWASLPEDVRQEIARRERDITTGLQRAAESRRFGDSVYQEVAPYMEVLRAEGATPQAAIKVLLETAYILRHGSPEHKRALMLDMIQQYGIDFSAPVDRSRAATEQQLDRFKHQQMTATAQTDLKLQRDAQEEVAAFAAAEGHEHFQTLHPAMAALLGAGLAKDLQDAYDKAAWADPTIRAQMQTQQNMQRQEDVQRHRNAASSVTGGPGVASSTPAANPKNLRGALEAAFGGGRV